MDKNISFIEKARNIHGDKYDYSKVEYINYTTKVCIICPEHGEFHQTPTMHLRGYGCPKCASVKNNAKYWEWRVCPICGEKFYIRKKREKITCSETCYKTYVSLHKEEINEKKSKSLKETFAKKTKQEKQIIQQNREKTFFQKYGTTKPNQSSEYREKMSKLLKKKDWSQRSENIKNNILIPKYKEICEKDNLTLLEFRNRFDCTVKCNVCGNIFDSHVLGYLTNNTTSNLCRICHPIDSVIYNSEISSIFEKILQENNIIYQKNNRQIIAPLELDFYIPELKMAFEINGNYWHSEIKKDKNYHINKTLLCEQQGVKLIHIFEDEIKFKYNIMRSRVENLLGKSRNVIYARKCIVKEITKQQKELFLNENHIDGDTISKYNLGLFYGDILVSVATFGKRKISKKEEFELLRFANKINYNIIGGFSKLITYFTKNFEFDELITYADIRWSGCNVVQNVYYKNGFDFVSKTKPNYFYLKNNDYLTRLNRYNFMKHKLVKMGYDKNKTEAQIMFENGYTRIWDCGSLKYKYKKRELV